MTPVPNNTERNLVRLFVSAFALMLALLMDTSALANNNIPVFSDDEVRTELFEMECIVEPRFNNTIRGHIVTYVKVNRDKMQRLLDKSMVYFPVIEHYLNENGLPEDLKYLAVIESSLEPKARSRAGAVGLWQFMSFTGREHGLRISNSVDERMDIHKSTVAAAQYLSKLYKLYGDWALAMAAYNSGPGRVNTAIRKSGSKDFWVLQRFLPRETRGYIPAYIAATYAFKHYEKYGFIPVRPDIDLVFTKRILVSDKYSFDQISGITGVDKSILKQLNPSYRYGYVPYSSKGYELVLPSRVAERMAASMQKEDNLLTVDGQDSEVEVVENAIPPAASYVHLAYQAAEGESLSEISEAFGVNLYQLKYWNTRTDLEINGKVELNIPILSRGEDFVVHAFNRKAVIGSIPLLEVISMPVLEAGSLSLQPIELEMDAAGDKKIILRRGQSVQSALGRTDFKPNESSYIDRRRRKKAITYGRKL